MGYRWNNFVSSRPLLHETDSTHVTWIVLESQLRLYGHAARHPEANPAHRVVQSRVEETKGTPSKFVTCMDPAERYILRQGKGPAWRLARRPSGLTLKGGQGDAPSGVFPADWCSMSSGFGIFSGVVS